MIYRETFHESELVKVDESEFVVLASGGPLMDVLSVEDGKALCEWFDQDETNPGGKYKLNRGQFPVVCLRSLVPYKMRK